MSKYADRRCPARHKHAEVCYTRHKCRCKRCRKWRAVAYAATADFYWQQRAAKGQNVYVPAEPTIRRLRALACIGWPASALSDHTGYSETHINRTRRGANGEAVTIQFARVVHEAYERLSMTPRDGRHDRKTKTVARRNGWLPPLAYDDIEEGIAA